MYGLLQTLFFAVAISSVLSEDFYWRDYHGAIPTDAVPAGYGLYIGQATHKGYLTPGTIYPHTGKFVSEYAGKFEQRDNVKILCAEDPLRLKWEQLKEGSVPEDLHKRAIVGGYERAVIWYIGRVKHQNHWKVGKMRSLSNPYLTIWDDDGNFHQLYHGFEILITSS